MFNRKQKDPAVAPAPELANKERDRAAAYARMRSGDEVQFTPEPREYPLAPNGRPYDPTSGRYMDR